MANQSQQPTMAQQINVQTLNVYNDHRTIKIVINVQNERGRPPLQFERQEDVLWYLNPANIASPFYDFNRPNWRDELKYDSAWAGVLW